MNVHTNLLKVPVKENRHDSLALERFGKNDTGAIEIYAQNRHQTAIVKKSYFAFWSQLILTSLPLFVADQIAIICSLGGAFVIVSFTPWIASVDFSWMLLMMALTVPVSFTVLRLYPGTGLNAVSELSQVGLALSLLLVVFLVVENASGSGAGTTLALVAICVILLATVPLFRGIARVFAASFSWWGQPAIILGNGETAQALFHYYLEHRRLGIRPVAIVNDHVNGFEGQRLNRQSMLSNRVEALRRKHHVLWFIASTPLSTSSAAAIRSYSAVFPYVVLVPDAEAIPHVQHQMFDCGNLPGILITNTLLLPLPRIAKATMDRLLAIVGSVICLPLIAAIVLIIKLTSPGPATFSQQRIGKGGRSFRAWKFRTMEIDADQLLHEHLARDPKLRAEWEQNHKLKKDPRVTTVGAWLRKTSLDELPQIWNVLRGEMSLVGPRPIVSSEIEKYGNWFELYVQTVPGITGLWQISGRNNTTYDMRVALDTRYVLNWSPWLDLYILARTIKVVLRQEGAY